MYIIVFIITDSEWYSLATTILPSDVQLLAAVSHHSTLSRYSPEILPPATTIPPPRPAQAWCTLASCSSSSTSHCMVEGENEKVVAR